MKINKVNMVSQYDLVKAYVEKTGMAWNDACDIVGDYDEGDTDYNLKDITNDIENDEGSETKVLLKEIMEENNITDIFLSRGD